MERNYWKEAVAFHGHECPGLAIGVAASKAFLERSSIRWAEDEELVCITENDACGVDAIQALLGCTFGKGNLLCHKTGKQAFTFFNRKTGEGVRLYLKARNNGMERAAYQNYLLTSSSEELFEFGPPLEKLPERARIFLSFPCEVCHEVAAEECIRIQEGKKVCLSCYNSYSRGW